ncbi:MAG: retroviral-like aspartic protease family protein [Actinomycetia bacterium]|nr:retroviral-like aspartic protease family protein [Actinomycetes bacterium]
MPSRSDRAPWYRQAWVAWVAGLLLAPAAWLGGYLSALGPVHQALMSLDPGLFVSNMGSAKTGGAPTGSSAARSGPRVVTKVVKEPVPSLASWPAGSWVRTGNLAPFQAATFDLKLVNPANGRSVIVRAEVDSGSWRTLVQPAVAAALGLEPVGAASIQGVAGTGPTTEYAAVALGPPAGQPVVRLPVVDSTTLNWDNIAVILGRDVLDQPGVTFSVSRGRWVFVLAPARSG